MAVFWKPQNVSRPLEAGAQIYPSYQGFYWKGPDPLDPIYERASSTGYVPSEVRYDVTLYDAGIRDYLYCSGLSDGSDWCVANTVLGTTGTLRTLTLSTKHYPPTPGAPNRGPSITVPATIAFYGEIPMEGYTYQHLLWYDVRTSPHSLLIYDTFRDQWRSSAPAPVNLTNVRLSQTNLNYFQTRGEETEIYVVGDAAMLIYRPFTDTWRGPFPVPAGGPHFPAYVQRYEINDAAQRIHDLCLFRGSTIYRWTDPGWTQTTSAPEEPSSVCSGVGAQAIGERALLFLNSAGNQLYNGLVLDPLALKLPDGTWSLVHYPGVSIYDTDNEALLNETWATVPLRLKSPGGWTEQAYGGTPLQLKDSQGRWRAPVSMWRPEQLTVHPTIWVTAEDMDVRDGDRVWEMYSQVPGGPPLIDGDVWIEDDALAPGLAYTDDPSTSSGGIPASGKQVRLRHDVDGRPAALLRAHSGNAVPYAERVRGRLFSPWWATPGTHYHRPFDVVHGSTIYAVFRMLGTGFFNEVSSYGGGEGDLWISVSRVSGGSWYMFHDGYRYDGWYPNQYAEVSNLAGGLPAFNQLYVLETTVHLGTGFSQRLNGSPVTFDEGAGYYDGPGAGSYPSIGDLERCVYIEMEPVRAPDGTYAGNLGFYLYEYKVWSGELTGDALAAERAYFSTKYGVPV